MKSNFGLVSLLAIQFGFVELIIHYVKYTNIDWNAYMGEVEGVYNGTFDYTYLRGDTGPLVYGGGFVSIYYILYLVTSFGANIRLAQHVFAVLYVATVAVVALIYRESKKIPIWTVLLLCLSRRIYSIFVLRLFNDCFAMFFVFLAIYLFLKDRWSLGCILYSFAVSVKMNGFLFAPGIGLLMLIRFGWKRTSFNLLLCFLVQVIFGFPFAVTNLKAYLKGTFDLGRVFEYKWSVNCQFLSEEFFVSRTWAMLSLSLCVCVWLAFILGKWIPNPTSTNILKTLFSLKSETDRPLNPDYVIIVLFTSNLIGITFARSLHYQFYSWYFHTLPFLIWSTQDASSSVTRLFLLFLIELCWNVYPPQQIVSLMLFGAHLFILRLLWNSSSVEEPFILIDTGKLPIEAELLKEKEG